MRPTLLFSNVYSIFNKLDEQSILLHQHHVSVGVFVESWLSEQISDDAVKIDGYQVIRKDRVKGAGGGIICYSKLDPSPVIIDSDSVPSLIHSNTEFLPMFFEQLSMLIIGVKHPFWNDPNNHNQAINCITDVIDHVVVHREFSSFLSALS